MFAAMPLHVNCEIRPMYGYLPDGCAGRIVQVAVSGQNLDPKIDVETVYKKATLKTTHNIAAGDTAATFEVMLPASVPTDRKSTGRDNEIIVRLRSLSPGHERVNLTFPRRAPLSVNLCTLEEIPSEPVDGTLTMPSYGMTTVKVQF